MFLSSTFLVILLIVIWCYTHEGMNVRGALSKVQPIQSGQYAQERGLYGYTSTGPTTIKKVPSFGGVPMPVIIANNKDMYGNPPTPCDLCPDCSQCSTCPRCS